MYESRYVPSISVSSLCFLMIIIYSILTKSLGCCTNDKHNLILVQTISRHGERAPVDTYPTDPHINATFEPFGWGRLTQKGQNQQSQLGKFIKQRYISFLKDKDPQTIISVQCTDSNRTKVSAHLQLMELWKKEESEPWCSYYKRTLSSIKYEKLDDDKLLLVRIPCPRYFELKNSVMKMYEETHKSSSNFYNELKYYTGSEFNNPDDVQSLYSTLKAEEEFGLSLPEWTKKVYPSKLYKIAADSFLLNVYNEEMQKLKAGPMLSQILENMNTAVSSVIKQREKETLTKEINRKLYHLYLGHDSTIANILIALKVWDSHVPPFNAAIIFELYAVDNDFAIQVFYKNSTSNTHPTSLKLPFCDRLCPLSKFIEHTRNVRPTNLKKECLSTTWNGQVTEENGP